MSDKSAFICTGISRQNKEQQTKLLIFFKSQLLLFHLSSVQEPILFVFYLLDPHPPRGSGSKRVLLRIRTQNNGSSKWPENATLFVSATEDSEVTLIVLTISNSAVVLKLTPSFLRSSRRYLVTSRPATSTRMMLCGIANPS